MVVHRRPAEVQAEVPTSVYALDLTRLSELLSIPEHELVSGFQSHPTASDMHGVIVDAGEDVPFETVGHVTDSTASDANAPHLNINVRGGEHDNDDSDNDDAIDYSMHSTSAVRRSDTKPPLAVLSPGARDRERKHVVRQVLITAAVAAASLDAHDVPKCLVQLGSQTIISHILTQLYAAGIERVVISLGAGGALIAAAVKQTPFVRKMQIEFLDLGVAYSDGHARSILAARALFPRGPFLIHTADHIFDKALVSKVASFQLQDAVACVLVETDVSGLTGLPPTAVRVQLGHETVTRIARDLERFDGFDAGLFVSSVAIFDALQELAGQKKYFSLAEALNYFTKFNKVTFVRTAGETWFSIETQEQLAYTKDSDGVATLSPWTVFLASTPSLVERSNSDVVSTKNVVIGVSAPDDAASLRVAGYTDASKVFDGFIIGVTNSDAVDLRRHRNGSGSSARSNGGGDHLSFSDDENLLETTDSRPLLLSSRRSTFWSSSSRRSRGGSFLDGAAAGTGLDDASSSSFVLSFPLDDDDDDDALRTVDNLTASRLAYLIEMNGVRAASADDDPLSPGTNLTSSSQYMLAVPGYELPAHALTPRATTPLARLRNAELLPTDITDISLATRGGGDDNIKVTVVVHRQVPLIGYVLLLLSLVAISSVGVALDMETHVSPLLKTVWRNTVSSITTLPLALLAIRRNGGPRITRDLVATMAATGAAYAFFLGSYVVSLSLTSLGHATLFNNAHSLLLVGVKLCLGTPVAMFEGLGAAVGVAGGAITTMDATTADASSASVVTPTALGDVVALVGAFGGATYFVLAKKLRARMDLIVFMCALTATSAVVLLASMLVMGERIELSMDSHIGLFGWMNPTSNRLAIALYLVVVCDLMGTMGYISVMKYFDPIVISVVCLLEPIVATAMGIVVGVDAIPGVLTFVGATLVIGGTLMVIATQREKTEQIDATDAIMSAGAATAASSKRGSEASRSGTPQPVYSTRTKRKTMNYGSVN